MVSFQTWETLAERQCLRDLYTKRGFTSTLPGAISIPRRRGVRTGDTYLVMDIRSTGNRSMETIIDLTSCGLVCCSNVDHRIYVPFGWSTHRHLKFTSDKLYRVWSLVPVPEHGYLKMLQRKTLLQTIPSQSQASRL